MAITWVEDSESRKATIVRLGRRAAMSRTRSYKVFGTNDESLLHTAVNQYISTTIPVWVYPNQPSVKFTAESYTVDYLGDDAWQVVVQYERSGADNDAQVAPLKRTRSFDTSGGTQHVTQCIKGAGTTAPVRKFNLIGEVASVAANEQAIGFDGEQVHGVDIVAPALQWTEQYDVPANYVTAAYIKGVASLTGTVNSASFRSFAAGEVLFVGASGSQQWDGDAGDGPWSLSYKFVASPNAGAGQTLAALDVGPITNVTKRGHDYLWVRYSKGVSDDGKVVIPVAEAVYVGKVYRDGNFTALGIGS